MDAISLLAVTVLLCNLYATIEIVLGVRKMQSLADSEQLPPGQQPRVSIIVPACNEEETIEPALRSLLDLAYDPLEIIVINDRSTDKTGEVIARIAMDHPQLRAINIETLPEGWLGKNHALQQGARAATGEYLLFTDADIIFAPSTLSRAMALMVDNGYDHLALIFKNIARGLLLNAMMVDAGGGLFFLFKPWKAGDPKSRHAIGVGAFNLIRKSAYLEIGGHETVRMHPIDDIMLGKIIKHHGFRQQCLLGYDFLKVHWYESPRMMIQGLMKNIFALYDFKVANVLLAVQLICIMTILPVWGTIFAVGTARICFGLAAATRLLSSSFGAKHTGTTQWTVPFSLVTPYVNIYIMLKGMVTVLTNRGIEWRGTNYPLDKLRKNPSVLSGAGIRPTPEKNR